MTQAISDPPLFVPAFKDLGELLDRLGNIPPQRIRIRPPLGTATEADMLAELAGPQKRLYELIDGVLVAKTKSFWEAALAAQINFHLMGFVIPRNLGLMTGMRGPLRLFPRRVRVPDAAYICWDRVPGGRCPEEPIADLVPNLAVEVFCVENTRAEMVLKRQDYFGAGVELVWEVDPRDRSIAVYSEPTTPTILHDGEILDGGTVLPGFSVPVRDVFAVLDRHG